VFHCVPCYLGHTRNPDNAADDDDDDDDVKEWVEEMSEEMGAFHFFPYSTVHTSDKIYTPTLETLTDCMCMCTYVRL